MVKPRDLNTSNIETERWNRMDHILRFLSYGQSYITYGDINRHIPSMYQGCQIILDTITPDFSEDGGVNEAGKRFKNRGMKTKRFGKYRLLLDQSMKLYNASMNPNYDRGNRDQLLNSAYRKLQTVKYMLLQECETLGYNAKKTDTTDAYREGNN